jgi:hypothetical protein
MTEDRVEDLDLIVRKASIANVERRKPYNGIVSSRFGGEAVGLEGEALPTFNGKDMFCLLQVNISELPYVPKELEGIALIVVFLNRDFIPIDSHHADGWLIREYKTIEGLQLLPKANEIDIVQSFSVRWSLVEDDMPDTETAWSLLNKPLIGNDELNTLIEKGNYWFTKFGGYPCEIHSKVSCENFVFQIRSEQKPQWMCDNNGISYFFKGKNGQWSFKCQLY